MFADYFGDLHFLQEELPRRSSDTRYLLIAARRARLYFNQPKRRRARVVRESGDRRPQ